MNINTADVAQLQDELTGALIGLAHAVENAGYLPKQASRAIIEGLFTTLTNVSFDEKASPDRSSLPMLQRMPYHLCALPVLLPVARQMIMTSTGYGEPMKIFVP